jgi:hypothetical protein
MGCSRLAVLQLLSGAVAGSILPGRGAAAQPLRSGPGEFEPKEIHMTLLEAVIRTCRPAARLLSASDINPSLDDWPIATKIKNLTAELASALFFA